MLDYDICWVIKFPIPVTENFSFLGGKRLDNNVWWVIKILAEISKFSEIPT